MTAYVFDTEPLIAYFYDEPGAETVREHLAEVERGAAAGALSHATATEIAYKVARLETGNPNQIAPNREHLAVGARDVRALQGLGMAIETPPWEVVAKIKAAGGISIGDAYAAALAASKGATLIVGADPEFDSLPVDVDVSRIRMEPA